MPKVWIENYIKMESWKNKFWKIKKIKNSTNFFYEFKLKHLPLLIHALGAATADGCCCGWAPNMSANGFPNCSRSSSAVAGCWGCAGALNKSTIFPDDAGGESKNGFVAVDGEPTFAYLNEENLKKTIRSEVKDLIKKIKQNLILTHCSFFFGQYLRLQTLINTIRVCIEFRWSCCSSKWGASRREGRNTALYVFLIAIVSQF